MYSLAGKNILLISPEPWSHIFVSKHHYAVHLGRKGNNVFFLNPPSTKNDVTKTQYENVWQVNYTGFPRGLRFFPKILQRQIIKKVFESLEDLCSIKFYIVWSFDNSVFYDFSALPKEILKISHIVDLNQDFQTKIAAETADVCFGVCSPIVKKLLSNNKNTFFINHGFSPCLSEKKVSLPGTNKIKAFYAGNLNLKYIDWFTFKKVVSERSEVDFIFAGPWSNGKVKANMQSFSNVYYLGQLKAMDLGCLYAAADVLLLLYRAVEFPEQLSNSHKMMEYLGSGKMIVASNTQEYQKLTERCLFLMAVEGKMFSQLLQSAIQNLEHWNSAIKQKERHNIAMENTYDKQIARIEDCVSFVLSKR